MALSSRISVYPLVSRNDHHILEFLSHATDPKIVVLQIEDKVLCEFDGEEIINAVKFTLQANQAIKK